MTFLPELRGRNLRMALQMQIQHIGIMYVQFIKCVLNENMLRYATFWEGSEQCIEFIVELHLFEASLPDEGVALRELVPNLGGS